MAYGFVSRQNVRSTVRGAELQPATSSFLGAVIVDGETILADTAGVISVPTGTSSRVGLLQADGTSILVTDGIISVSTVSTDGTSVTSIAGVLAIATSSNGFGIRTVSTADPSGGNNGDIWYKYV
jgi:sirohydrochlorin ferrochelatase